MQSTQTPTLVPLAFAANGQKNVIPEQSQISTNPGAASLNDGFPPLTMIPRASGGIPPSGFDFNGIFNLLSQSIRWSHAGGSYSWSSAFASDSNVGGYPQGAQLLRADLSGFWLNTVDNNPTNPDATDGSASGWVPGYNYGVTTISGLTNANMALSPMQAAKNKIVLSGALTGSISIVFPAWTKEWVIVNNTTGAFTITATTASGTGVALPTGQTKITGDGTNIVRPFENVPNPGIADSSQKAASTQSVWSVLGNYGSFFPFSAASQQLTASQSGDLIYFFGSSAGVATLPQGATIQAPSARYVIYNGSLANLTVSAYAGDVWQNWARASEVIGPGDSIEVAWSNGQYFNVVGGTAALKRSSLFAASVGQSGWEKLPNGTIRQWGVVTVTNASETGNTFNFPIAFPNACFVLNGNDNGTPATGGNGGKTIGIGANSNSQFSVNALLNNVWQSGVIVGWEAIGW
ncbi:putative exported phage protein [Burkholderia aenigmatica]|uniref:Putative exported phage protein n=1 Tax=Burkholderia aenigmatica TaxID=2015348 RepID=A0A6P2MW99_9BURK|nr:MULTISPECIES: hypothetical protein [Burkholderia]VWB88004.1 putative exported phage protein [Burkholderia aenigmatica]